MIISVITLRPMRFYVDTDMFRFQCSILLRLSYLSQLFLESLFLFTYVGSYSDLILYFLFPISCKYFCWCAMGLCNILHFQMTIYQFTYKKLTMVHVLVSFLLLGQNIQHLKIKEICFSLVYRFWVFSPWLAVSEAEMAW